MSKAYKSDKVIKLSTDAPIPAIGLGTWQSGKDEVYNAVITALKSGYRHIDTATLYKNEDVIGQAIKDSGIPREEIFVTTKLASVDHHRPIQALEESLERLKLDYVDLYLIHWPVALNPNGNHPTLPLLPDGNRDIVLDWDFTKTYKLLETAVTKGLTKALGVSNFSIKRLQKLLDDKEIPPTLKPAANQVELHPYLPQTKLVDFCHKNGIAVEAYSPLGSSGSPLLKDEAVVELAEKYGVEPATILISWAVWRKTIVLPKSVTPKRIISNLEIVDLSDEDGLRLTNLTKDKPATRFIDPNWYPLKLFDDEE